jgi:single-stranded-DNA-specific exonuclease
MGVPLAFAQVLASHGVCSITEARAFLSPDRSMLHDPSLLPDIDHVIERVARAVQQQEKVLVCGDYDVDGITSVVLVKRCLEAAGLEVDFYIPNRLDDGYGLSEKGVVAARDSGAKLIVTVDSGVTGHEQIKLAHDLGLDVIVTDHHEPQETIPPEALAVVDPKRADSSYPFKHLAGVGVAFKVMEALARDYRDVAYTVEENLDLVAVGTIADIVPLVSENRVLAWLGLERLRVTTNAGLRALMEVAGVERAGAKASHIGFALGPRLNAAGRLGDASIGVELLTTEDPSVALEIARKLDRENKKRRDLERRVLEQATETLEATDLTNRQSIVLWSSGWHPGVIGIVASRIAKQYNRPTVLLSVADGMSKGSGRSIPGFDLHAALAECRHCLTSFGGHRHAAGVSIEEGRLEEFRDCVESSVSRGLTQDDLVPMLDVDAIIGLDACDVNLVGLLKKMRPFGAGNPEPIFGTRRLKLIAAKSVGNGHLKMTVAQGDRVIDAIGFGMAGVLEELRGSGGMIAAAYVLEENTWRGVTDLQLRLKDVQPEEY